MNYFTLPVLPEAISTPPTESISFYLFDWSFHHTNEDNQDFTFPVSDSALILNLSPGPSLLLDGGVDLKEIGGQFLDLSRVSKTLLNSRDICDSLRNRHQTELAFPFD